MTNKEKLEVLDNMLICYVDRTNLTNKQIEESEIFIEELRETILVTRCCCKENYRFKKGDKVLYNNNIEALVVEDEINRLVKIQTTKSKPTVVRKKTLILK